MKFVLAVLSGPILVLSLLVGVAGAQSYEGATLDDGIFFVPDNPTGGEDVNLAIAGLAPNAEVRVELLDSNNASVDGLVAVQGVVVFRADANGALNADFTLPPNLPDGAYSVVVTSIRADNSPFETTWSFVVDAQTTTAGGGTTAAAQNQDSALALTGASSRSTAVGGGVLVLLGLGLVVVATTSRRRDGALS